MLFLTGIGFAAGFIYGVWIDAKSILDNGTLKEHLFYAILFGAAIILFLIFWILFSLAYKRMKAKEAVMKK